MPRWRASSTPSKQSVSITASTQPETRPGEICSDTSRASTIPVACTRHWAISAPPRPNAERLNPVHFSRGDQNYTEIIAPEKLEYPEDEKKVLARVKEVLKHIISIHSSTNDTIILVTHQIVCRTVLKIVKKFGVLKPSDEALNNYPKGGLTLVLDEGYWIFKPINWKDK
jgi:hypothetical protein